jgi:oligoendopeptidase F
MIDMRWDLGQLLEGSGPEHVKAQLEAMVKCAAALAERYRGKISALSPSELRDMLVTKDDLFLVHEGAMLYSTLAFAADTTDPAANSLYNAYSDATTEVGQHLAFMGIELGKTLSARPELLDDPVLADYRHYLERALRAEPHLLSEAEERVIMAKDQNGPTAWSKLQSRWLSTRSFTAVIDGQERTMGIGEIVSHFYDADRANRRNVYQAVGETLARDEVLWADALRAICSDHRQMCRLRRYPSPVTSSLIANDVDEGAVGALIGTVEKNASLCQRFFKLKAKLMGLETLGSWDLRAPLPDAPDREFTWDEAYALVRSVYSDFDGQWGRWVEDMYTGRRMDGEPRKGKRTGAFCETWVDGKSAFVLSTYSGRTNDVYTLAHELGHAVHAYLYTRAQNLSNCQVSMCVAECGSLFGELLLTDRLLSEAHDPKEKRALLVRVLNSFVQTVYQEGFRYFFEESLYDALEQGRFLDGEAISELWTAAQRRIYGNAIEYLPVSKWDWARFPHHYFAETRFYDYPYVFAQLFVFALFRLYKEQGEAFKPQMDRLLSAGSSRSAWQLASELGFDIRTEEFWQKGIDQAGEFLEQLERL